MKLVVLDLDDTLYLERDYVRSGFRAVAEHVERTYEVENPFDWLWDQFESGTRGQTFDLLAEKLGLPDGAVVELVRVYRDHNPDICLEPDALEFLEQRHGVVPLALITDGYGPGQRRKINALGIEHYFDDIIVTGELGEDWPKPSSRSFAYLQHKHGVAPEECIYIADNPAKDFAGPESQGWSWVRVRRNGGLHSEISVSSAGAVAEVLTLALMEEVPRTLASRPDRGVDEP